MTIQDTWTESTPGGFDTWTDASAWTLNALPTNAEDAFLGSSSFADVAVPVDETVNSIAANSNDVLDIANDIDFTAVAGTGPNVNEGEIVVSYGTLSVGNATFNNGSTGFIELTQGFGVPGELIILASLTLTGSGALKMQIGSGSNEIVGISEISTPDLINRSETISGTGTIGGNLNFTNDSLVETNNTTSSSGGFLTILASADGGSFTNNGTVQVDNGGTVEFGAAGKSATVDNELLIVLNGGASSAFIEIAGNVTIDGNGAGFIEMQGTEPSNDEITSDGNTATLALGGQTVQGAGHLGDSRMTLDFELGTVIEADATGQFLVLYSGSNTIDNAGVLSAENGGILSIDSAVNNSDTIDALAGSAVNINASISGTGLIDVNVDGTVQILFGATSNNVNFAGPAADLALGGSASFTGDIVGLEATDSIDLLAISPTGDNVVWQQTSASGGTLSLDNSGTVLATLNLLGQYVSSDFAAASDGVVGTRIDVFNSPPPAGTTGAMIMRDGNNGDYEIYDLGGNAILAAGTLGQVGTEWLVAGVGGFDGADTSDMILRATSGADTGAFELYDISNNNITNAVAMGHVGLAWVVSGFGDFSGNLGETDMLMQNTGSGDFEVYDISNNAITSAASMGQVGLEWSVAGFGDFSGNANESDMLMRNNNTGAFEIYDISNNAITSAGPMGQVGLEWSVAGFGDFSTRPNETDMLMRNNNTGAFEIYDISNNQITSAAPMGQVGLEWSVVGFGPLNGAGSSDMLMRDNNTGAFEVYDISNNQITFAGPMGQVGLEWSVAGIAADPPGGAPSQLAQSMASYPPGSGVIDQIGSLTQTAALITAANPLAAQS